jgi:hypothetical protein
MQEDHLTRGRFFKLLTFSVNVFSMRQASPACLKAIYKFIPKSWDRRDRHPYPNECKFAGMTRLLPGCYFSTIQMNVIVTDSTSWAWRLLYIYC